MPKRIGNIPFSEKGFTPQERADALFARTPRIQGYSTWLWHVPDNTVRFSEEWRHLMLFPEDMLLEREVSRWWPEMVHEDDIVPFLEVARDIVEGKTRDYQTLFRIRRSDGSWAWLLSRGRVTETTDEGHPIYVYGFVIDISHLRTDVKFQHEGLASFGPSKQAQFENSPDVFVRLDRELFPLYANQAISRYLKRSGNLTDGEHSAEAVGVTPAYLAMLQRNVDAVYQKGTAVREQVTFPTAYGHNVVGEYSFWPEFDSAGKVVAAMTQFRDITDQVLAERFAHLNELRLEALHELFTMDSSPQEKQQRFVVESMLRVTESESGFLFFPDEDARNQGNVVWSRNIHSLLETEELPCRLTASRLIEVADIESGEQFVSTIRNGNSLQPVCAPFSGKMKVLRYILAPVVDDGRIVCVAAVCNKKTEYKKTDLQELETFISGAWFILRRHDFVRKLQLAKEQAESAYRTMAEFLTNVNHELRTPLTSILGYSETLVNLGPGEETFRDKCVEVIQSQARQMHKLVMDLLNLSRIEGAVPLHIESTNLEELMADTVGTLQMEMEAKELNICTDIPVDIMVKVDRHYMSQVFRNVLENAIVYSETGSVVSIQAIAGKKEVIVSIQNQGSSIEESELEQIFERFYRGKHMAKNRASGTGVGLSICKHVVERHGGRIWAESSDSSVTIRFSLPA